MKRIIATIALTLPLAALCVFSKSASAEPVNRDYTHDRQPVTGQRDNRSYDRDRQPNPDQRFGYRHQRQWVAAHYERVNHHRRWVPGHYEHL